MFIIYKIIEELTIEAEKYTQDLNEAVRDAVFQKYLYKINKLGICVKIKSIEILDNTILRKEADLLVRLAIEFTILKLIPNEYFEGEVISCHQQHGILVAFLGILEGKIQPQNLHEGSLFNGKWILPFDQDKAFSWQTGDKIRFKIQSVDWSKTEAQKMHEIISLKCNEQGLGPVSWWL